MEFRKYEKIHRLGKEETDGILFGRCHIEEKVDGANLSVWKDDTGEIRIGSRNQDVTNKGFNGAVDYVLAHPGIVKYLEENPTHRLYGEWLVRHTISYNETTYKKFYLFDIKTPEEYLVSDTVHAIADKYSIEQVPYLGVIENPTQEQLMEMVGKSKFGDRGEGIVIKNPEFINSFGDRVYAKIVTETFKEDNGVMFGGNNKFSDTYHEMWIVNKYITLERVKKIMDKIQPLVETRLDMKDIPRVCNSVYHDVLVEEIWEIQKKCPSVNFHALSRIAFKKAKQVYIDILNDVTDRVIYVAK